MRICNSTSIALLTFQGFIFLFFYSEYPESDRRGISDLRKEVQTLADQVYQDAGGLYYPAQKAASQVFASRYKMRNGVFTKQDRKHARLAAQQAIQKRRQDKVESATTTITITGIAVIAVDSAEEQVKANGGNSRNLQR